MRLSQIIGRRIEADFMEDSPKPIPEPDWHPVPRMIRWPRPGSIADIIMRGAQAPPAGGPGAGGPPAPPPGGNPYESLPKQFGGEHLPQRGWEQGKCPPDYRWDKPTGRCVPSQRKGTSGVPQNWEEDPQFSGNPNKYKRIMNRCPPGYISNERGNCIPDTDLRRKQRERVNRTKPSRLKDKE